MKRRDEQPSTLSELLDTLAGRLKRVDLRLVDAARQRWPEVVDPVLAEHCRVEMIRDRVLVVSVPSGAFAQRVMGESPSILRGFATLGTGAPTSLRTVMREPKN